MSKTSPVASRSQAAAAAAVGKGTLAAAGKVVAIVAGKATPADVKERGRPVTKLKVHNGRSRSSTAKSTSTVRVLSDLPLDSM